VAMERPKHEAQNSDDTTLFNWFTVRILFFGFSRGPLNHCRFGAPHPPGFLLPATI